MLPDDDEAAWDYVNVCLDCDGALETGRTFRCEACLAAAYRAIERSAGTTVRPSDIDAAR